MIVQHAGSTPQVSPARSPSIRVLSGEISFASESPPLGHRSLSDDSTRSPKQTSSSALPPDTKQNTSQSPGGISSYHGSPEFAEDPWLSSAGGVQHLEVAQASDEDEDEGEFMYLPGHGQAAMEAVLQPCCMCGQVVITLIPHFRFCSKLSFNSRCTRAGGGSLLPWGVPTLDVLHVHLFLQDVFQVLLFPGI